MTPRINTRAIQARNKRMLAACDVCHLCGHPGSDAIDHVTPWIICTQRGIDPDEPGNLRPAHHTEPCPTCGKKCNRLKSDNLVAPVIRRSGSLAR